MEELELDQNLWFYHKGCSGKHYFLGNPHTFPGRILGWCPEQQRSFFLSISEIEKMSEYSRYWIKGYLTGNQPPPPRNQDRDVDFGSEAYQVWHESINYFLHTGFWTDEKRNCLKCKEQLLMSEPKGFCKNCK